MFDLDELKQHWAQYDRKLDASLRLNHQLLRSSTLKQARSELQKFAAAMTMEAIVWLAIVIALGRFLQAHAASLRLTLCAAVTDLYCIALLAATIRMAATAKRIDYSSPVAAIQKQIETLRAFRIRTTQVAVLAGIALWAPCFIVAAKACADVDLDNTAWIAANAASGLLLIPITIWAANTFAGSFRGSPWFQRFLGDIAGTNLTQAQAFLAELAQFSV